MGQERRRREERKRKCYMNEWINEESESDEDVVKDWFLKLLLKWMTVTYNSTKTDSD
jgi:hypothetical protein